jgi:carboxyl-terminal processing protease
MKLPTKILLGILLSGTMLGGGAAMAQSDSPYPYCQLLEVPPVDPHAPPPVPLSSPESAGVEAAKVPTITDLLKQTTDAADIVNRILSQAAPAKPEELEGIYNDVYSNIVNMYIEPSRIEGLKVYADKYKGKITTWAQLDAAISDVVHAVGDRWTWYNGPVESLKAQINANEKMVDLGVHLRLQPNGSFIVEFMDPGSTAQLSGLREGDTIVSINGKSLSGLTKDAAEALARATDGNQMHVVSIQDDRQVDALYTVHKPADDANAANAEVIYNNIGYVKLPTFLSEDLFQKLLGKLLDLQQKTPSGMQALILDLRYNGGGRVDLAKGLIRLLLEQGVTLHERTRNGVTITDTTTSIIPMPAIMASQHSADELALLNSFKNLPLVILINGSSASASEIVTGTLRDSRPNTLVMGERSFGKGVEMSVMPLKTCGQLAITSAAYTTPSGKWLHNVGIQPDVVVHQVRGIPADTQLESAVTYLKHLTANNGANVAVTPPGDAPILGKLPDRPVEHKVTTWQDNLASYESDIIRGAVGLLLLSIAAGYLWLSRGKKG